MLCFSKGYTSLKGSVSPGAKVELMFSLLLTMENLNKKSMMEHSENAECITCTVCVNTYHYDGSLCSGTQTKTADPKKIQKWPY